MLSFFLQELAAPRLELDYMLKLPAEERLIQPLGGQVNVIFCHADLEQTGTAQAHNGFPLPGTQIWKILSDLVIGDLKICAKTV